MAYLNVRDRLIETKIAYVGPELGGKSTNFERLREDIREGRAGVLEEAPSGEGQLVSFDWRPLRIEKLNDCEVVVRLTSTNGSVASSDVEKLVADADGVVLVLDADPAAKARNEGSVASLRDALARAPKRARAVVVQVNKCDLPDAVASSELRAALDLDAWPHQDAAASTGDGVIETLQRALGDVLESIKEQAPQAPAPKAGAPDKTEGNPLLAALRQVLKSTVAEHVTAMEERLAARIERELAPVSQELASLRAALSQARSDAGGMRKELEPLQSDLAELRADVGKAVDAVSDVRSLVVELAKQAATTEDVVASELRVAAQVPNEVVKKLEAKMLKEREQIMLAMGALQRAIENVAHDVKTTSTVDAIAEVSYTIANLDRAIEGTTKILEPTTKLVRELPSLMETLSSKFQTVVDQRIGRRLNEMEGALRALDSHASEGFIRVDERANEVRTSVGAVLEELTKPKKGWFG